MRQWEQNLRQSFLGAISFYTIIPIPNAWGLDFNRIARWAPLVGLLLGAFSSLVDFGLTCVDIPIMPRSALVVAFWLFLTGGLHLDGVGDAADGLGVQNPQKRLAVMKDSVTGAFGVMAITLVLLLKTVALSEISEYRWFALMAAGGWGRWGQVMAIAFYPYLRNEGKGAFHKRNLKVPQDIGVGFFLMLGLSLISECFYPEWSGINLKFFLGGVTISLLTGFWFYRQFQGQTGDTYGAIVEWTEALFLCLLTSL